ncbi:MAG: signal peptidase I [Eubacteriales bacterium]|nr:signal peptidase I [Eubacteriales bacterium]
MTEFCKLLHLEGEGNVMNRIKRIWNVLTTAVVIAAAAAALFLVGIRLAGMEAFTVLSGSMEPAYPVGSLIYVKREDCGSLKVGDPITFVMDEDMIVTHRITEILYDQEQPELLYFRTKGDANDTEDGSLVFCKNVIGKPIVSIPYLGYAVEYVKRPPGIYLGIGIGAFLLMLMILPDVFEGDKAG